MRQVETRDESMTMAKKEMRGAVDDCESRNELLPWASPPAVIAQRKGRDVEALSRVRVRGVLRRDSGCGYGGRSSLDGGWWVVV